MKRSLFSALFLFTQLYSSEGFIAGTLVLTPRGKVPIESLKKGDSVISFDESHSTYTTDIITDYIATPQCNDLRRIHIGSSSIVTQPNHQLHMPEEHNRWQRVKNLTRDSVLLTYAQHKDIQDIIMLKDAALPAYTLSVQNNHNFLITDEGILVHNVEPATLTVATVLTVEVVVPAAVATAGLLTYFGSKLFGKSKSSYNHCTLSEEQRAEYLQEAKIKYDEWHQQFQPSIEKYPAGSIDPKKQEDPETLERSKDSSSSCSNKGKAPERNGASSGAPQDPKKDDQDKEKKDVYENNPKHHPNSQGNISKPPQNGQKTLDNAIEIKPGHKIGVENGKLIEFRQHGPGKFHGYEINNIGKLNNTTKAILKDNYILHKTKAKVLKYVGLSVTGSIVVVPNNSARILGNIPLSQSISLQATPLTPNTALESPPPSLANDPHKPETKTMTVKTESPDNTIENNPEQTVAQKEVQMKRDAEEKAAQQKAMERKELQEKERIQKSTEKAQATKELYDKLVRQKEDHSMHERVWKEQRDRIINESFQAADRANAERERLRQMYYGRETPESSEECIIS